MPNRTITVLYIDDDEGLGRLVQRVLGRRGYEVEYVATADAGVARVDRGNIDIVILDHDLGSCSGLDVIATLNSRPSPPPVVYVTASSELSIAVQALKAGAVDYVVKTIGEDFEILLVSALEHSVEKARLARAKEKAEREVREARDRAVILLAEVNHRVANSLALVSSLVRMQSSAVSDPSAKAALAETQARISAIANLHRSLYTSDDVRSVDLATYLGALVAELTDTLTSHGQSPTIRLDASPIIIATDKAVSLGMIANELITNAVKYAYPLGLGEVRVSLRDDASGQARLLVEDDGVGWDGKGKSKGTGLGSRIVSAMAKSLGTDVRYEPTGRGTRAALAFKVGLVEADPVSPVSA